MAPLPAVWDDDALHFCTGPDEQKGKNLQRNPKCALTTGVNTWNQGFDLVVEGEAVRVVDEARLQELADGWLAKYGEDWHFEVADHAFGGDGGEAWVYAVRPAKLLGFAKDPHAQTRWRFAPG